MNYLQLTGKSIREAFIDFHRENPHVYREFERQCLLAINNGRNRLSAKLIINYIRWNEFIRTGDKNFKINDILGSYYARLFTSIHPEHESKFEFRKLRNEVSGPYMQIGDNGQVSFI